MRFLRFQRHAQHFAESRHYRLGGCRSLVHQSGDGVQRIEKEARIQLHLQNLQLRQRQSRFQLRRTQLLLAVFALKVKRMTDT
jgi:hypothetical protein